MHLFVFGNGGVALGDFVLDLDGAANGLDDAGKLGNNAVSRAAENVAVMRGDRFLDHGTVHAQSNGGGFFVTLGMPAIAHDIGSEYRSKPTFHGRGTRAKHQMAQVY